MIKSVNVFAVCLIVTFCMACSNNVSKVKKSVLNFDKSLTIGQAIDRYKYFSKTTWQASTTDNGRETILVTGEINLKTHPDAIHSEALHIARLYKQFKFTVNLDGTVDLSWCGNGVVFTDGSGYKPGESIGGSGIVEPTLLFCILELEKIYNESPDIQI